jgi:hypothetical protein
VTDYHPAPESPWPPLVPLDIDPSGPPADLEQIIPPSLAHLGEYLRSVADSLEVPVELPLMLLLPTLGAAIAGKREIYCGGSWTEPPALWTMTLLGPGNRKSAVFKEITRPIREWERLATGEAAPRLAKAAHARELAEKRLAYLRTRLAQGKASDLDEEEAERIVAKLAEESTEPSTQITTSEITTEALTGLLARNGERALVTSAEPDVLEVIMGRYNSGRANYGVWLAGHAGDPIRIDRSGGKSVFLARPCVSIGLVPQPAAVRQLLGSEQAKGRGFVARFLSCCPRDPLGSRPLADRPIDAQLQRRYADLLQTMLDEPLPGGTPSASGEPPRPRQYALSRGARSTMLDFRHEIESAMRPSGDMNDRRDFGSKLPGAVARIALVFHAAEQADASGHRGFIEHEVPQSTVDAAIRFGEWASAHDAVAQGLAGSDPARVAAELVMRFLRRDGKPQQTRADIYESVRGRAGGPSSSEELDQPLAILLEAEIIREINPCPNGSKPKKNQRLFAVHPEVTR